MHQKIWKKIVSFLVAFSALISFGLPIPTAADIGVSAACAVLIEAKTGTVLYEKNAHEQRPMASTTKIMTSLIALEQPNHTGEFIVDDAAIMVEGTSMGLKKGDTVSLKALAIGMLMVSGNDAANAAAVRISGSVTAFSNKMNQRAEQIGMKDTHFETPSGLDAKEHYSTAYDMALLAKTALNNPEFAEICAQKKMSTSYGNPPYKRTLYNHNRLLSIYEPCIGVKTGFTKKAGRCLVSAAQKDGVTLICVTLGAPDDWNDHQRLFEMGFSKVSMQPVDSPKPVTIPVTGGTQKQVTAAVEQEVLLPVIENAPYTQKTEVHSSKFLYPPIEKGDIIGNMVYYANDVEIASFPLVAQETVLCAKEENEVYQGFFSKWIKRLTTLFSKRESIE